MATSQDLLHVDPKKEFSPFLLKKDIEVEKGNDKPDIRRIERSSVLAQVKSFLPLMESANQALSDEMKSKPITDFDIENVENDDHFVEMNIGLFEKEEQSSSEESSDSDEEQICKMLSEVTEDNIKLERDCEQKSNLISEVKTDVNKNIKIKTMDTKKQDDIPRRQKRRNNQKKT